MKKKWIWILIIVIIILAGIAAFFFLSSTGREIFGVDFSGGADFGSFGEGSNAFEDVNINPFRSDG